MRYVLLLFVTMLVHGSLRADETASSARLYLRDGDFVDGRIIDCETANTLRWQTPVAVRPFEFPLTALSALHYGRDENLPKTDEAYAVQLAGGDLLHGQLVSLSADALVLESKQFGRMSIARGQVQSITRLDGLQGITYYGPNGLRGWEQVDRTPAWQDDAGHLLSKEAGGSLAREIAVPDRACIELSLSWTQKPQFEVAIGKFLQLETFSQQLVLVRESEKSADLARIDRLSPGSGRIDLFIYVDLPNRKATVHTVQGKLLAEVSIDALPDPNSRVELTNFGTDLRVEKLVVRGWNGYSPAETGDAPVVVRKSDGTPVLASEITLVEGASEVTLVPAEAPQSPEASPENSTETTGTEGDADAKTETDEAAEAADVPTTALPLDAIAGISLANPADAGGQQSLRVSTRDGCRVSGELQQVRDGQLIIVRQGIAEPISIAADQIDSLVSLSTAQQEVTFDSEVGRLESEGVRMSGKLIDSSPAADESPLWWQPNGSSASSPLVRGLAARIVYRETPAAKVVEPETQVEIAPQQGFFGAVFGLLGNGIANNRSDPFGASAAPVATPGHEVMVLNGGDRFPCHITSIGETSVEFTSDWVKATRLPVEMVKAWETSPHSNLDLLPEDKRRRLLTLPRMQRNSPPTHLVESHNGDFLRGRVVALDDKQLTIEVRLEERQIERRHVRRIVWLDEQPAATKTDGTVDNATEQPVAAPESDATLVQAIHPDGVRMTFTPHSVAAGKLVGDSATLGACQVMLGEVDQLVIGGEISRAATQVVRDAWQLRPAIDPKFVNDEPGEAGGSEGTESALVGQPAPDFKLQLLSGEQFELSQQRGKIVVLDFWATWCGPCVQAMPQVEEVVSEFAAEGVQLVAVNMQEDNDSIKSLLERLEISPTVALDIDGATAEKYQVSAIPQTVVIDREGNVARLFIGGGPQFADDLRAAIKQVAAGNAAASATP